MAKSWLKKEEDFLKKHYRKTSIEDLAKKFNVSPESIRKKEKRLGLLREHSHKKKVRKEKKVVSPTPRKWTEKEERYLREHYLKKANAELAKRFLTTAKSIEKKLWRMGLKRKGATAKDREKERSKKIEGLLRKKRQGTGEKKVDERRSRAIAKFDVAIRFYYAKKYQKAEIAFEKIVEKFADVSDIVYKAKQYIGLCKRGI